MKFCVPPGKLQMPTLRNGYVKSNMNISAGMNLLVYLDFTQIYQAPKICIAKET